LPLKNSIQNPEVASVFDSYSEKVKTNLMKLREIILEVAASSNKIGKLEETLKWGEPSYLTSSTGAGSTIRIDWKEKDPGHYAIFFKCTTNLVETFKEKYPEPIFKYSGTRAILFKIDDPIPEMELKSCIALALTYHLNKKLPTNKRWEMVDEFLDTHSS
jgi:hypothetical protein